MTTAIRFYAGVSTSGGTIIEVSHGKHRLVFDFGYVFDLPRHVFDGTIRPGGPHYLADLLALGLLPRIDGVFSEERLRGTAGVAGAHAEADPTMVLISHPHEDHIGAIGLIDPQVPVVMSEDAATLIRTLHDLGEFDLPRNVTGVALGEAFTFGPFEITARYSDHPAWGSVGYEIASPDGRLFWTGDWRLHGKGRTRVLGELASAKAAGIDLLITEGTSLGSALPVDPSPQPAPPGSTVMPDGLATEEGVDAEFSRILAQPGIVILNIYNRDFSPLQNVLALAREAGRNVAVQADVALILERLTGELFPVYLGREGYQTAEATPGVIAELLSRATTVDAAEVAADPSHWLVQFGYPETAELLAFAGAGGSYLHVGGLPLGPGSPEHTHLQRVLDTVGISYTQSTRHVHFAHATPGHIALMTELLDPRQVAIVHAPYPGMTAFEPPVGRRVPAEAGIVLHLDHGHISEPAAASDPGTRPPQRA